MNNKIKMFFNEIILLSITVLILILYIAGYLLNIDILSNIADVLLKIVYMVGILLFGVLGKNILEVVKENKEAKKQLREINNEQKGIAKIQGEYIKGNSVIYKKMIEHFTFDGIRDKKLVEILQGLEEILKVKIEGKDDFSKYRKKQQKGLESLLLEYEEYKKNY